ncbi:zinc finger CCHC domain-containing protein 3-like isoform X1 [Micropterus dolomieu]|uniref:zinc finger CCHC domain-containing protein 3-like isoform X1 n=1 Tax=Micropterus dolomieu TaxID=147949 RepID=UPI001E8DD8DD|nr:zinc finger CCHC domain-containing protein 3-like isoform X1 [Micropterus dolomieu]XP_045898863.1 zinc finger CCHC domain-containing protein 3-like isoform X1 [Micropterus dolomieu]
MAPAGLLPQYASKFGQFWVRLKYIGDPPTREYVGEVLLFESVWINVTDVYSFIALPNKKDFELCFFHEAPLKRFLEAQASKNGDPKWKDWSIESSIQMDITNIIVKFWTGRVPDHDIDLYLSRFCEILHSYKPVDKFGIWYGVRRYKVKMRKDANGHTSQIPNSISLGPYNGRIIYSGQSISCFICHSTDHQVKQCPSVKCWKCGNLGHKAKVCNFESQCSLCGEKGHIFFSCPSSYVNKARAQQQSGPPVNQRSGPPSAAKPLLLAEPQQPGPLPAAKERPDPPPSVKQQPATEQHQPGILPAKQRCDPPPSVKQQPATEQHQPGILPAKQRSDPPPSANQQSSTDQQQPGTLPAKHRSDLLTVTKQQSSCSPALCQSSYRCLEPSPAPRVYLMFSFSPYRGIVVRPSKRRFLSRSRSLQLRPLRMPSVHQVRRLQVYVVRMHIENSLI